jgi:hypothetical protein
MRGFYRLWIAASLFWIVAFIGWYFWKADVFQEISGFGVLHWSNLPEDVRKSLVQQADAVGGLP